MNDIYVDLPDKTQFLRTVESTYAWSSQDRFFSLETIFQAHSEFFAPR